MTLYQLVNTSRRFEGSVTLSRRRNIPEDLNIIKLSATVYAVSHAGTSVSEKRIASSCRVEDSSQTTSPQRHNLNIAI